MEKNIIIAGKTQDKTQPFIMSSDECHDIDTEEDWALAEMRFLFKKRDTI